MSSYQIIELPRDAEGGVSLRGASLDLWNCREPEAMLSGPAETGKTITCCTKLNARMWVNEGSQGVIARKTLNSIYGSVLQSYMRVIGMNGLRDNNCPIKAYGGEKPEFFQYPNGSRVWIAGLDNPGKALSSERSDIYVNQAEELDLEDWETLLTRCTGRGFPNHTFTQLFGDCNPRHPKHWIKERFGDELFHARHEDNPTLFDDDGNILPQGIKSLSSLDRLTGTRYQRLRLGNWVGLEGVVYPFQEGIHLIDRHKVPHPIARYEVIDWGFNNPLCWQNWYEDYDGNLYLWEEVYATGMLVEDLAHLTAKLTKGQIAPRKIICDHDLEDRKTFERHRKLTTIAADKGDIPGRTKLVISRFTIDEKRRKPRIYIVKGARRNEEDQELKDKHKPTSTEDEFAGYVWEQDATGKKLKDIPKKENDHGMNAMEYLIVYRDRGKTTNRTAKSQSFSFG
jgi:PBSX family phage terminase large subunit